MKILIIDSNVVTFKSISSLLNSIVSDIESIDMCNAQQMAIQMIGKKEYDLIFIANKYRDGSGYDAARGIHAVQQRAYIIMYGEEESVEDYREILSCGALDYLVKPFTKESLSKAFEHYLDAREQHMMELIEKREKLTQKANELIEFSFIYSVLFNGDLNWEWQQYQYLLNISGSGYVMYISLDKNEYKNPVSYERYSKALKKGVTAGYKSIVGREITRRIVVFVMAKYGLEKDRDSSRTEQLRYGEYVRHVFRDMFQLEAKIGIGTEKPVDKLPVSYEEALRNLRFDGYAVIQDKEIAATQSEIDKFYYEMEQKLMTNIREGSQEAMNSLVTILDLIQGYSLSDKKNKILELLVMASHIARADGKNESEYTNYMELARQLNFLEEETINAWACRSFSYVLKSVRDMQSENSFSDIRKVLRYVDTHYDEDISLEEVASILNISPQYFSRIFKEKVGVTYVDYLTKVRIKKAKEWLVYSDDNVQEVCYKVGYKDPNYFARVFKKSVGVTPRQYKAQKEGPVIS